MHKKLVINTGPIIALIVGLNNLKILEENYEEVYVPKRVAKEILVKGNERFDAKVFLENKF